MGVNTGRGSAHEGTKSDVSRFNFFFCNSLQPYKKEESKEKKKTRKKTKVADESGGKREEEERESEE